MADAAQRLAELREQITTTTTSTTSRTVPRSPTPSTTRWCASSASWRRAPRARHARQPDPARRRAAPSTPSPRSSTGRRCCRSTTPPARDDLREFEARIKRALPGGDVHLRVRAQDRRPRGGARLRARPLVRGATRGDGRRGRGRHPQPPHHPLDPLTLGGPLAEVGGARGPRRGLHAHAAFERLNRDLEAAGEAPFANPRNAAAGAVRQKDPGVTARRPLDIFLYHLSHAGPSAFTTHGRCSRRCARAGLKTNPRTSACATMTRSSRTAPRWRPSATRSATTPTASWSRSTRSSSSGGWAPPPTTRAGPSPSSSPPARPPRVVAGHRRQRRQDGRAHARRQARAGRAGRRHHQQRQPAQRGRDPPQGRPRRRHRAHRARGRRHPLRRPGRRRQAAPRRARPFAFPDRCPACGGVAFRPEGEAYWRCTNAACPAQLKERLRTSARAAPWTSSTSARPSIEQLVDRGLVNDFADLYRLTADAARRARAPRREVGENLVDAIAGSRTRGLARLLNALGIRSSASAWPSSSPSRFGSIDRIAAAAEAEIAEIHGIGPRSPLGPRSSTSPPTAKLIERLPQARRRPRGARRRRGRTEAARRQDVRPHGHARRPSDPRRGAQLIERLGGRVDVGVAEDRLRRGRRGAGSKADDARRLGVPSSTRPGSSRWPPDESVGPSSVVARRRSPWPAAGRDHRLPGARRHPDAGTHGRRWPRCPPRRQEVAVAASTAGSSWSAALGRRRAASPPSRLRSGGRSLGDAPPLPAPVHHAAAAVGERLFVIGGYTGGRVGWTPLDTVYEYDEARGAWVTRAPMPTARGGLAVAALGGRIHAVGGAADAPTAPTRSTTRRRTGGPRSRCRPRAITSPRSPSRAACGRSADARRSSATQYANVEIYDPPTDSWSTGPAVADGRGGLAAAALPDRILVFGGEAPLRIFNATEMYEAAGKRWIAKEPMPTPRHGIGAAVDRRPHLRSRRRDAARLRAHHVNEAYAP